MRPERFGVVLRLAVFMAGVLVSDFAVGTLPHVPAFGAVAVAAQDAAGVEASLGLDRPTRQRIQQGLRNEGFDPGTPDGLFGSRSRAAIRAWQAAREQVETGYLDGDQSEVLRAVGGDVTAGPDEAVAGSPVADPLATPSALASASANCEGWNTGDFFETATVEDVTTCLAAGVDVNANNSDAMTPLHWAPRSNEDAAVINELLQAGADPTARNADGLTAAQLAERDNQNHIVVLGLRFAEVIAAGVTIGGRQFTPGVGTSVVPRADLPARINYPSTFSFSRAEVVTTVSEGDLYVVQEFATVPSVLLRDRYYLRIKEFGGAGPCQERPCWVYQGSESSDRPNFLAAGR